MSRLFSPTLFTFKSFTSLWWTDGIICVPTLVNHCLVSVLAFKMESSAFACQDKAILETTLSHVMKGPRAGYSLTWTYYSNECSNMNESQDTKIYHAT